VFVSPQLRERVIGSTTLPIVTFPEAIVHLGSFLNMDLYSPHLRVIPILQDKGKDGNAAMDTEQGLFTQNRKSTVANEDQAGLE